MATPLYPASFATNCGSNPWVAIWAAVAESGTGLAPNVTLMLASTTRAILPRKTKPLLLHTKKVWRMIIIMA